MPRRQCIYIRAGPLVLFAVPVPVVSAAIAALPALVPVRLVVRLGLRARLIVGPRLRARLVVRLCLRARTFL